ncbi:hypothetical protein BKA63DRAFT_598994 [Paraphoma chrysanthemicola]|nr:hypothetical protein BKA63DRAFT_598994 [Paraphoma chrysanthemicola]
MVQKERISFPATNAKGTGTVQINRTYLIQRINQYERQQAQDGNIAALVRRRDRLHYDEIALANFESGEGRIASTAYRWEQHKSLREAYARWEDFLYYQNPVHRWERLDNLRPEDERRKPQKGKKLRLHPTLFRNVDADEYLRTALDFYDEKSTGGEEYRRNLRSAAGRTTQTRRGLPRQELIGPEGLHRWTPVPRRMPNGLRNREDLQNARRRMERSQPALDEEAIEQERGRIERATLEPAREGDDLEYETHEARRKRERANYWTDDTLRMERPSTSNIRCNGPDEYEERFGEIRTDNGLFLSAKESSDDWLTSYDCLHRLDHMWTADVAPELPSHDGSDDLEGHAGDGRGNHKFCRADSDAMEEVEDDESDEEALELFLPPPTKPVAAATPDAEPAVKTKGSKTKSKGKGRGKGKSKASEEVTEDDEELEKLRNTARLNRTAARNKRKASEAVGYGYEYENREFSQATRPLRTYIRLMGPKTVIEATDGRREWHVGMMLQDSSPPTSPPRGPMLSSPHMDTIPEGLENLGPPPVVSSRCPNNTPHCRAWWGHAPDECWQALVETFGRPNKKRRANESDPSDGDGVDMNIQGGSASETTDTEIRPVLRELLLIPESGRHIYRERLYDHYGRTYNGNGAPWPRLGLRVPYEPLTTLNEMGRQIPTDTARTTTNATAVVSMAFPIILESQRGFGERQEAPKEMPPHMGGSGDSDHSSDGEESDDEGDLFRESYMQGSGPPRADPASDSPEERPDPPASD